MRLARIAAASMLLCTRATAFVRPALRPITLGLGAAAATPRRSLSLASSAVSEVDKVEAPELVGKPADFLRTAGLTAATGDAIKLGDVMGDGKSVVIFLRHLG